MKGIFFHINHIFLSIECQIPALFPTQSGLLTHSLIHNFETVPNSKKLQTTTEMWLLKDFKVENA